MAELVIALKNRELYEASGLRYFHQYRTGIMLLEAGIPDAAIERKLCDDLIESYANHEMARKVIVEALRVYGSIECLIKLEGFEFDFSSKYNTAKVVYDPKQPSKDLFNAKSLDCRERWEQLSQTFKYEADISFGKLLCDAIRSVRERNQPLANEWGEDTQVTDESPFVEARKEINLAYQRLVDSDLSAALNHLRQALESLLKTFIKKQGIKPNKDVPVDELQLDTLISIINSVCKLPKWINSHIVRIQKHSTLGSHHQGQPIENLTSAEAVKGDLAVFSIVEKYFIDLLGQK